MEHSALVNLLYWQSKELSKAEKKLRTVQYSSISFDVSAQEIFLTLFEGGTLFLINGNDRKDFKKLHTYLLAHKIERIFLPFVSLNYRKVRNEG